MDADALKLAIMLEKSLINYMRLMQDIFPEHKKKIDGDIESAKKAIAGYEKILNNPTYLTKGA